MLNGQLEIKSTTIWQWFSVLSKGSTFKTTDISFSCSGNDNNSSESETNHLVSFSRNSQISQECDQFISWQKILYIIQSLYYLLLLFLKFLIFSCTFSKRLLVFLKLVIEFSSGGASNKDGFVPKKQQTNSPSPDNNTSDPEIWTNIMIVYNLDVLEQLHSQLIGTIRKKTMSTYTKFCSWNTQRNNL